MLEAETVRREGLRAIVREQQRSRCLMLPAQSARCRIHAGANEEISQQRRHLWKAESQFARTAGGDNVASRCTGEIPAGA